MQKLFLLLLLQLLPMAALSQKVVEYNYDSAGNRISRSLRVVEMRTVGKKTNNENTLTIFDNIKVKIYPNPTKGMVKVEVPANETDMVDVRVFSFDGVMLMEFKNSATTEIDMSKQPNGNYILSVSINQAVKSWNIIKE